MASQIGHVVASQVDTFQRAGGDRLGQDLGIRVTEIAIAQRQVDERRSVSEANECSRLEVTSIERKVFQGSYGNQDLRNNQRQIKIGVSDLDLMKVNGFQRWVTAEETTETAHVLFGAEEGYLLQLERRKIIGGFQLRKSLREGNSFVGNFNCSHGDCLRLLTERRQNACNRK